MATERSSITTACLRYLNRLSGSRWLKTHGSGYGVIGQPDILGCYHGRLVMIEIKTPGKRPTARQEHELFAWGQAGALTGWATSPAECRSLLWGILTDDDKDVR
jgi:hypothetical protein